MIGTGVNSVVKGIVDTAESGIKLYQLIKDLTKETYELSEDDQKNLDGLVRAYEKIYREVTTTSSREDKGEAKDTVITLPLAFQYEGQKPKIIPREDSLNVANYESYCGTNVIATQVRACITLICHFQQARNKNGKKTWDSVGLFCYFLKSLFVQFSNQDLNNRKVLEAVEKLLGFIEGINNNDVLFEKEKRGQNGVFDQFTLFIGINSAEYPFSAMLAFLRDRLKKIETIIKTRINNLKVREHARELRNHIQNVFEMGIQIALRVPSKTAPSLAVTPLTIIDAHQKTPGFTGDKAGWPILHQCIYELTERSILCPKPVGEEKVARDSYLFQYASDRQSWSARGFSVVEWAKQADFPRVLFEMSTPGVAREAKAPAKATTYIPPLKFDDYLKFLAMLELLSENYKLVSAVYDLSGKMGNWGIYNQLSEPILQLCEIITKIIQNIREAFEKLCCGFEKIELRTKGPEAKDITDGLRANIKYIEKQRQRLKKELQAIEEDCGAIRNDCEYYILHRSSIAKKLTADMAMLIKGVNRSVRYLVETGIMAAPAHPLTTDEDVFFAISPSGDKGFTCMGKFLTETEEVADGPTKVTAKELVDVKQEIAIGKSKGCELEQKNQAREEALKKTGVVLAELEDLERQVEATPKDVELLTLLGLFQHKAGQHTKAIATLEKSLTLHPENPETTAMLERIRKSI